MTDAFESKIVCSLKPFEQAVLYAIVGNIIDFNPIHNSSMDDIMQWFENADEISLAVNHIGEMETDIQQFQ